MVKLVIVDMDGTFLDDEKKMSPEADRVIDELKKKGVIFCVASGRQLDSIKKEFKNHVDDMIFIAENGTVVEHNKEIIVHEQFPKETAHEIIKRVYEMEDKKMVYSTKYVCYVDSDQDEESKRNIEMYLPNHKIVDSFYDIEENPVKMSVYTSNGVDPKMEKFIEDFSDIATVCTSGFEWVDIIPKHVNKGTSVAKVQKILGITPEETMAFGDQMNDFEMLQNVYYSYAMENAVDEIKQICRFVAPPNNEYGVVQVLKEHFGIK